MKKFTIIVLIIVLICGFTQINDRLFIVPANFPEPAYNFTNNELSEPKILLGKTLFYDPVLSRDNSTACSSCHLSYTGFAHTDHALSHGIDNKIGIRNSPALMNLAWSKFFMWDGAIHHLDAQALAPITNPLEMDESLENVVHKLQSSSKYKTLFTNAFGDSNITGERTLKSISQFLVTLVSANSKYDKVMRKEEGFTFTESETKGYTVFKQNCASCHKEPLFTNNDFENNGLPPDTTLNDVGRIKITGKPTDAYKFKVPTLRNCEISYPYMHDGRFNSLQMVLFHYTNGIYPSATLAKQLKKKIVLSEDEKSCLILFLKTLTDEDFLRNEKFR